MSDDESFLRLYLPYALREALGADAQHGRGEHSGAQPHGRGARARARADPHARLRDSDRCKRRGGRGALPRRDGDPDRRHADAHQVLQPRDPRRLPQGGDRGGRQAAFHAARSAARKL